MTNELLHGDLCLLCSRPLEPEFRGSGLSAQQDHPACTDFHRYHCASCADDMTRVQEWADLMHARYDS